MVFAPFFPECSLVSNCLPSDLMHPSPEVARLAQTGTVLSGKQVCLLLVSSGFPQGTDGEPFWKIKKQKTPTCALEKCHLLLCKGCAYHGERPKWYRASSEWESLERLVMCQRSDVPILLGLC